MLTAELNEVISLHFIINVSSYFLQKCNINRFQQLVVTLPITNFREEDLQLFNFVGHLLDGLGCAVLGLSDSLKISP